jgi:hypothetical protein
MGSIDFQYLATSRLQICMRDAVVHCAQHPTHASANGIEVASEMLMIACFLIDRICI